MRTEVLDKNAPAPLRVFVVWFNMLPGDSRQFLDTRVLADPRVSNYWDEQKLVGRWYSDEVAHRPGITWDTYFLYGRDARWASVPGPLISSGGPVIGRREQLAEGLRQIGFPLQTVAAFAVAG